MNRQSKEDGDLGGRHKRDRVQKGGNLQVKGPSQVPRGSGLPARPVRPPREAAARTSRDAPPRKDAPTARAASANLGVARVR